MRPVINTILLPEPNPDPEVEGRLPTVEEGKEEPVKQERFSAKEIETIFLTVDADGNGAFLV